MPTALIIYSGGLDTTVCIPLMREEGFDRILTVTVDVGQPADDIAIASERAAQLGTEHFVADVKEEFAREYCSAAIRANADYFGYPLSTSIARPLIAKCAAEKALELGNIDAFVHGCTGKGNDQFRIEFGLRRFAPQIPVLAPIRERNLTRSWEIEYAERVGAPIGQSKDKIWSIDENLWGRSIEGGRLEEPNFAPPEEIFQWTKSPQSAPDQAANLCLRFEDGLPVQAELDGQALAIKGAAEMITTMNALAGEHGIGRIDIMEDRMIGLKVRENYECPGATLLIAAHKALEALVTTKDERRFKRLVDEQWSELAYQGLWWDPLMEDLVAFQRSVNHRVCGEVWLRLFKGSLTVVGRESRWALYDEAAASFDDQDALPQAQMTGMVRTHGMASLRYARLKDQS